jgi:hypothetical protein
MANCNAGPVPFNERIFMSTNESERVFVERRRFGRRKVLKSAVIRTDSLQLPCFVLDISIDGAKIRLPADTPIVARFDLLIEVDDFIVQCNVVHQTVDVLGVQFISSPRRLSWSKPGCNQNAINATRGLRKHTQ